MIDTCSAQTQSHLYKIYNNAGYYARLAFNLTEIMSVDKSSEIIDCYRRMRELVMSKCDINPINEAYADNLIKLYQEYKPTSYGE